MNPLLSSASSPDLAVCTIISKNYLPYARVLAHSFNQFHSDIPFYVLLVDEVDGYFEPEREPFNLVTMGELNIQDLPRFCFQYTPIELNTAVKPFLLSSLLSKHGFSRVIYFDPDILILRNLSTLFNVLNNYSIILTPHLTHPIPRDGRTPTEIQILQAGTYNLGFIALANTRTSNDLLTWWQDRLYDLCQMAPDRGLHVDQKWIDLVPGFFKGVHILQEPGYNIAYWNLATRRVEFNEGEVTVNNEPAYFLHFSGISPENPRSISRHSNRFDILNVGQVALLYQKYVRLLIAQGFYQARIWPYAYGAFDNGVSIPDVARHLYLRLGENIHQFGNPFFSSSADSYFNWLNASVDNHPDPSRTVTRLWYEVYNSRPDVWRVFPHVLEVDRDAFLDWTIESGLREYGISERFIQHSLKRTVAVLGPELKSSNRRRWGVNLAGAVASEKGSGEAVRSVLRILEAGNIPAALNDFEDSGSSNTQVASASVRQDNPYYINIIATAAGFVPSFVERMGQSYFAGHYNIGYWLWELTDFPKEWLSNFKNFDEIWVASSFVRDGISRVSPVPVISVPHSIIVQAPPHSVSRFRFGLPRDTFIFFFMFDFHSYMDRKNPLAVIKAFKKAFSSEEDALLLIKCSHSRDAVSELQVMQDASTGSNIRIYDCVLRSEQVASLLDRSDCYVSLHRAEGFGLTIAEAMSMGKPVIATGYSGNMEYMTSNNSFPVKYKLIPIAQTCGPYKQGFVWADPDLDHAAELMRFVYDNREIAKGFGRQGQLDVLTKLSPTAICETMKERIRRHKC